MKKRCYISVCMLLLTMLLGLLSACGKKDANATEEYPRIVYVDNVLYYGSNEICENVPRKMPDGIIGTYVPKEIMPDSPFSANFGSEDEKVEYMFLEDGRMIVHVGNDWFYFNKENS